MHKEDEKLTTGKKNIEMFNSLLRMFAQKKKMVRFLNATPNVKYASDEVDEFAPIGVHLPVTIGGKAGHIGFTKKRRSSNVVLHNPTPRHPKAKSKLEESHQTVVEAGNKTPAALREISNRAQSALASLYEDISDDEFHPPGCVGCVKGKLDFDE